MADNCMRCGKSIGYLTTQKLEGGKYCLECIEAMRVDKKPYLPDIDAVRRALSALLTQDGDTKKLFDKGSRTYFKLFGGDINNFINLNSNLVQASIMLLLLERIENIEKLLEAKEDT